MLIQMLENDSLAPSQSRELQLDLLKGEQAMIVLRYSQPCSYRIRIDGIRENPQDRIREAFSGISIDGLADQYLHDPILCAVSGEGDTLVLATDADRWVNTVRIPSDKLLSGYTGFTRLCFRCPYAGILLDIRNIDPEQDLFIHLNRMVPYTLNSIKAWTDRAVPHHVLIQASVLQEGYTLPFRIPDSCWYEKSDGVCGFASSDEILYGPVLCWI